MYEAYIILEGKPLKVISTDVSFLTKEEAMEFCEKMADMDKVCYVNTDQGIVSYNTKHVQSVFYLCKNIEGE